MLISLKNNLCILAMPKTGTTAIEAALAPYCDMVFTKDPRVKHMPLPRFTRFIAPYLREIGQSGIETTCLIRHPEAWLGSWYRYRARPALNGHENSTAGIEFEDFVAAYLAETKPAFARVGRPARFVGADQGRPGVTHLFKYENFPDWQRFLEARFGTSLDVPRKNVSPARDLSLSAPMRRALETRLAEDYALYENAG